jgi:hypothetical protein
MRAACLAVLIVSVSAHAAVPDPVSVVKKLEEAINAGDLEKSLACWTDDAVVTSRPGFLSKTESTFSGRERIREWMRKLFKIRLTISISVKKVEGNRVITDTQTWNRVTKLLGIAPLVGTEEYLTRDDKIASLTWTASPDTLRKFSSARSKLSVVAVVVVVLLALVVWLIVRRIRRRRRLRNARKP